MGYLEGVYCYSRPEERRIKDATVTYRLDFRNLVKGSACEGRDGTEVIVIGIPPRVNATPIRALDVSVSHHGMEEKFGEEWCLPDLRRVLCQ